ncbi:MAG: efflux transporter outer membrane subunit [Rubrivivax sp.]
MLERTAPSLGRRAARALGTASLLAAAGLAGCALTPTYERPPAPVAAQFPLAGAEGGPAAAALDWDRFIEDARTQALVRLALQNNRDLRVALLNVERARAVLGVQRADLVPSVAAGVSVERTSNSSLYTSGFIVPSFELDLFGRVRSLTDAAAARVLASDESRRAVQLSLIGAVAETELALRADDALIELGVQVLESRRQSLGLVQRKFDGGVSGEPELRANQSLVEGARVSVIAQQRARAQHQNALVLLIGQPLPADLPPPRPLIDHRFADVPAGLPSDVLLQRPDVRAAEQQLMAANADIGAARAAFFPRISLTASLGLASTELSGLFDHLGWSFAPQLLQPIFNAGRNRSNLEGAEAARDIAVAQYDKSIQSAFREVADGLAARATLGEQLQAQQAQADAEARRLAVVEQVYAAGAASALDRLDAERSQAAARVAVVQLQLAQRQNALLLYRVLGGGVDTMR